MAADLDALRAPAHWPPALRIVRVRTLAQIRDFAAINAANWDPHDPDVIGFYEAAASVLLDAKAPLWLYVGYLDDRPAAASELTVGGGVVGLYGVSTAAAFRRQGIGAAMTLRPLHDAQAAGYRMAVLQASEDGARVYARIGFTSVGRYIEYKPPG
jgi:GNAT superfamily N-acetyltransferase